MFRASTFKMENVASSSGSVMQAAGQLRAPRPSFQAFARVCKRQKLHRRQQQAMASMGIGGFTEDFQLDTRSDDLVLPGSVEYGLSAKQMQLLGLSNQAMTKLPEVKAEMLTAKCHYVGDFVETGKRQAPRMAVDTKAPGQAPPDLPSLLLDGRICYIGMPLVQAVTELVISELLWLNYSSPEKPIYLYINSSGSQTPNGEAVGFETEAYAILDTLAYIRPDFYTVVIGQAFGNAAMLLAAGKKGNRYALPHARIMTCPPRMNRSFGNTTNIMIKANELEQNTQTYVDFMSLFTGKDKETIRKDIGRNRYFTPEQAIDYGIIDRVVAPTDEVAIDTQDYEGMLRASQSAQRGTRFAGAGAGAEAGN